MSDRDDENLRNAILKKKALLAHKESILGRPPITKNSLGMACKESEGSRVRLHEDCQHLRQSITELETGMLLRQYHRSIDPQTRNVVAQAAIEKKLAERGIYPQNPHLTTEAELVGSPSPNQSNKPNLNYRSPLRKATLTRLTQEPNATDRDLCNWFDDEGAEFAELPPNLAKNGNRSFATAYLDDKLRQRLASEFSKVRGHMRACGLLPLKRFQ